VICGRRMTVGYRQHRDQLFPDYRCMNVAIQDGGRVCQRIGGVALDATVTALLLQMLTPLAIQAALAVSDTLVVRAAEADRLRAAHVQRAQHRADLARRRYLAVDPDNRLVAEALEADWNAALHEVATAQQAYARARSNVRPLDEATRARLGALAADVHTLWHDPVTPMRERKRIARLLITDVTLMKTDVITAHIRLRAGQEHTVTLPLPLGGGKAWQTHPDIVALIDELLDHTHAQIAAIRNQRGLASGKGRRFHALMVRDIRDGYRLKPRWQRLREQGLLTLAEISQALGVSPGTVKIWTRIGLLQGVPVNDKNCCLYPPPGPDRPQAAPGRSFRTRRQATAASCSAPLERGAV
jgi:hypothetical protein